VLAAKERTDALSFLAASGVSGDIATLPETRVRGSRLQNHVFIGVESWLSSTTRWGCEYCCDGTASVSPDQRYYANTYGRFLTKDYSGKSARLRSPQTWNRYSYASNDPVNRNDPKGLCDDVIGGITQASSNANALNQFASDIGAVQAFPYASGSRSGVLGAIAGLSQVAYQALLGASPSTFTAFMSVMAASQDPGPINIFTFSGGAQAFASAYQYLPTSVQDRINNVTYVSPGAISGSPLPAGNGSTTAVLGRDITASGAADVLATLLAQLPAGTQIVDTACGHDSNCEFNAAIDTLDANAGNACSQPTTISRGPNGTVEQVTSSIFWYIYEDDAPPSREEVTTSISFDPF
jgi:RHS repeat-associated protein